jgi:hypothetical protein
MKKVTTFVKLALLLGVFAIVGVSAVPTTVQAFTEGPTIECDGDCSKCAEVGPVTVFGDATIHPN